MINKIEVYVRNEDVVIAKGIIRPVADHWCSDGMAGEKERIISESDRLALNVAEEFAREKGLNVVVYDIQSFRGRFKAMLNRVYRTPTIIVGTSRIEGDLTADLLKSKLQGCLNE
jgi:hypothetical protein